jgi:hypothetical protein
MAAVAVDALSAVAVAAREVTPRPAAVMAAVMVTVAAVMVTAAVAGDTVMDTVVGVGADGDSALVTGQGITDTDTDTILTITGILIPTHTIRRTMEMRLRRTDIRRLMDIRRHTDMPPRTDTLPHTIRMCMPIPAPELA